MDKQIEKLTREQSEADRDFRKCINDYLDDSFLRRCELIDLIKGEKENE